MSDPRNGPIWPLRKIESGLYETHDGQHRVERIDGYGAPADGSADYSVTTQCWVLTKRPEHGNPEIVDWDEIAERSTRRECVAVLTKMLEG